MTDDVEVEIIEVRDVTRDSYFAQHGSALQGKGAEGKRAKKRKDSSIDLHGAANAAAAPVSAAETGAPAPAASVASPEAHSVGLM